MILSEIKYDLLFLLPSSNNANFESKVNGQSTNIKVNCKDFYFLFFGALGTIFGAKQTLGRFPKMLAGRAKCCRGEQK